MPRILVALDDSCGSEKALEAAVNLAQHPESQVHGKELDASL